MAYKQIKKYGYRDSLEKGDPEKVIYGVDFDAEFEAIEEAFDGVPGAGGGPIAPDEAGFEDVVFQNRTEDQQVISKFTFTSEKLNENHGANRFVIDPASYTAQFLAGSDMVGSDSYNNWDVEIQGSLTVTSQGFPPYSMQYLGVGMRKWDEAYVQHRPADDPDNPMINDPKPERWVVKPYLYVDGDIDATGSLNVDQNVTIGGQIDGDLTVNGNIIIDGGTITQPGGEPIEGPWHIEDDGISYKGVVADPNYAVYISGTGDTEFFASVTCSTLESRFWKCTSQDALLVITSDNLSPYFANGSVGKEMDLGSSGSTWKDGHFSGAVKAGYSVMDNGTFYNSYTGSTGISFAPNGIEPTDNTGTLNTGVNDIGSSTHKFKNGYFTGAVYSDSGRFVRTGQSGVALSSEGMWPSDGSGGPSNGQHDVGNVSHKWKDAHFSGTVNAGSATFTGTVTANAIVSKGNVTAYSSSDERLKDEISPMPVGLIDAIDASQWKWKEDGRSSGGVVAQQLQEIGLDDWVREAPNGDLGVDYNALIGMLIAEVQDLKRRLADG